MMASATPYDTPRSPSPSRNRKRSHPHAMTSGCTQPNARCDRRVLPSPHPHVRHQEDAALDANGEGSQHDPAAVGDGDGDLEECPAIQMHHLPLETPHEAVLHFFRHFMPTGVSRSANGHCLMLEFDDESQRDQAVASCQTITFQGTQLYLRPGPSLRAKKEPEVVERVEVVTALPRRRR